MNFKNITPLEFAAQLQEKKFILIDVRQAWELEIAKVENALHLPLDVLEEHILDFNKDDHLAFLCHHGGRSARAAEFFYQNDFNNLYNIKGGINKWSETVDSSIAKY